MRSWFTIAVLAAAVVLVASITRAIRAVIVSWMAARSGVSRADGRRRALTWYVPVTLGAALIVAAGLWADQQGRGLVRYLGVPAGLLVLATFVPFTSIGAPKLTRWQKTFGRRLHEEGAARDAADAVAGVARVFSVIGLLLGVPAFFLVAHHGA